MNKDEMEKTLIKLVTQTANNTTNVAVLMRIMYGVLGAVLITTVKSFIWG